jgi:hypothetical protein
VGHEPERWRRGAILNIPPFPVFGANLFSYDQIKRTFYFWFFQMQEVAEEVISAEDFAFIDRIWGDWSPGYDATEDLPRVKECVRDPAHFHTALGYYWGQFDPPYMGSATWAAEQEAACNRTQATLSDLPRDTHPIFTKCVEKPSEKGGEHRCERESG